MGIKPLPLLNEQEWSAVRRLCDAVNAHVVIARETWQDRRSVPYIGVSLETGACIDNVLYDSRADCARHLCARDPYVFPVKISPMDITPKEAWVLLSYGRMAKERGVAFHQEDPLIPHRLELVRPLIPRAGLLLPSRGPSPVNRAQRRHPR